MGEVTGVTEQRKITALRVYGLSVKDRKRIFRALPEEVASELKLLIREIDELGVPTEVARQFVWGSNGIKSSAQVGAVGWLGFISVLEAREHSGRNVPTSLIRFLQDTTKTNLGR